MAHIPKWLFAASFFIIVLLLTYLLITGSKIQFGPDYYGFITKEENKALSLNRHSDIDIQPIKKLSITNKNKIAQIETKLKEVSSSITKPPISLIREGKELEKDKADRTYYVDNNCIIGEVRAGLVDAGNYTQAGICVCMSSSPKDNTGMGWYCID